MGLGYKLKKQGGAGLLYAGLTGWNRHYFGEDYIVYSPHNAQYEIRYHYMGKRTKMERMEWMFQDAVKKSSSRCQRLTQSAWENVPEFFLQFENLR
jgi:hypothetical protein